jgi:hypothetical protein
VSQTKDRKKGVSVCRCVSLSVHQVYSDDVSGGQFNTVCIIRICTVGLRSRELYQYHNTGYHRECKK